MMLVLNPRTLMPLSFSPPPPRHVDAFKDGLPLPYFKYKRKHSICRPETTGISINIGKLKEKERHVVFTAN